MASRRHAALVLGVVAFLVTLGPPLHQLAERSQAAHMAQHVALLVVVAPLVVLGLPMPPVSRGRWPAVVAATFVLQALVMVGWHAPPLYDAALRSEPVHVFEHLSIVATAALFWWPLLHAGDDGVRLALGALVVFAACVPCTVLGVGMTLATTPWYSAYVAVGTRAGALDDQQVAGVVMWAGAGTVYFVAAMAMFGTWLAGAGE